MPESSMRDPAHNVPVDLNKPLFDSRGNLHAVVLTSQFQLLTTFRGLLFVWDRNSGESLMKAAPDYHLANDPLPKRASTDPVTVADRKTMSQSSMVIDCLIRSSRAEVAARRRAAGSAEPSKP